MLLLSQTSTMCIAQQCHHVLHTPVAYMLHHLSQHCNQPCVQTHNKFWSISCKYRAVCIIFEQLKQFSGAQWGPLQGLLRTTYMHLYVAYLVIVGGLGLAQVKIMTMTSENNYLEIVMLVTMGTMIMTKKWQRWWRWKAKFGWFRTCPGHRVATRQLPAAFCYSIHFYIQIVKTKRMMKRVMVIMNWCWL